MGRGLALLHDASARLHVKVCCIGSIAEAELALEAGADALGLVSAMPSGPGVISDADIASIAAWIGERASSVLLTSRQSADAISEQLSHTTPDILQIVDTLPDDDISAVRTRYPEMAVMPVVHVTSRASVDDAVHLSANADAILLDSGNPSASVKELGGTGRVHDWEVSRAIREAVPVPLFLAGGLRPENVARAVAVVRPFGIDVCSGVRRDGRLDRTMLTAFIAEARNAF